MKLQLCTIFLLLKFLTVSAAEPMKVPQMVNMPPSAGKRIKVIPPEYKGTDVYYSLYLPDNYKR